MVMRDVPEPSIGPAEVLLRVAYAGICGSELSGYLGHNALRVPPLVMGHEFSGVVIRVGPEAHGRYPSLVEGASVTVNPLLCCNACEYCRRGQNHLCSSRKLIGVHRPGAYAEQVSAPVEQVVPLPAGLSLPHGALAEPVAVAVHIAELVGNLAGEDVLVVGAGPIGLLALQALQTNGAGRTFISDLDPDRLKMGESLGGVPLDPRSVDVPKAVREATGGRGVAAALDAVGATVTRAQCVAATRSGGTVILTGLHEETGPMPAADIIRREIVVRGAFGYTPSNFAEAVRRLAEGGMRLDPWVRQAPLEDGGAWFDRLVDAPGDVAKVLLVPRPY